MPIIIQQPTITAEWQALVKEAQIRSHLHLDEDLESYLTFLLVRFTRYPEMADGILAFDYLHGLQIAGQAQINCLRDVGDKCLLLSGFFPERAEHKHVRISYFVDVGQGAYAALSNITKLKLADLYAALSTDFVSLMDVLHAIRESSGKEAELKLMHAAELWHDTASKHALTVLRRHTKGFLVANKSASSKIKH